MTELAARVGSDSLRVELRVDRVGSDVAGVMLAPDRREAVVVLAPAERARAMPRRKSRRFVEEEELGEATGLQEWFALPSAELEPARDPALPGEAPPNAPARVVQAAAVSVHEAAGRIGDEPAERRDPVLTRHRPLDVLAHAAGHVDRCAGDVARS